VQLEGVCISSDVTRSSREDGETLQSNNLHVEVMKSTKVENTQRPYE
jgi:hypothetical protein